MSTRVPAKSGPPDGIRHVAIRRLRKKRELRAQVWAYLAVNIFLIGIWFFTDRGGLFWPIFPILGWGIGLGYRFWTTYSLDAITEEQIQREVERLRQP